MAKRVRAILRLQLPAGSATPAPPVGPALGQHGVNIMGFVKEYNARTANQAGTIIPAEITVFEDSSFTFVTKTPPAPESSSTELSAMPISIAAVSSIRPTSSATSGPASAPSPPLTRSARVPTSTATA